MEIEKDQSQTIEELVALIRSQLHQTERELKLEKTDQNLCFDYALSGLHEAKSRIMSYMNDVDYIMEQSRPHIFDPNYRKKFTRTANTSNRIISSIKLKDSIETCMHMLDEYKEQLSIVPKEKPISPTAFEKQIRDICASVGVNPHPDPPKWTLLLEVSVVDIYFDPVAGPYQVIHEFAISDGVTIEKHLFDLLHSLKVQDMKSFQENVTSLILWERQSLNQAANVPSPVVLESSLQQYVVDTATQISSFKVELLRISNGFHLYYYPSMSTEPIPTNQTTYDFYEKHFTHKMTIYFEKSAFFLKLSPSINISLSTIQQHPDIFRTISGGAFRDPLDYLAPKYLQEDLDEKNVETSTIQMNVRGFILKGPKYQAGPQSYTISKIPFLSIDQIKPLYMILKQTIQFEKLASTLTTPTPIASTNEETKEIPIEVWINSPSSVEVSWMDNESAKLVGLKFSVGLGGTSCVEPLSEDMAESFPGKYLNTILAKSHSIPHVLYYALQKKYFKQKINEDKME